jgi:hypothetical protein
MCKFVDWGFPIEGWCRYQWWLGSLMWVCWVEVLSFGYLCVVGRDVLCWWVSTWVDVSGQGYAIFKLISSVLETMKDTPIPSVAVLLVGAYWRPPWVCCAAEGSARGECVRKGCEEGCSFVVMSSFVGCVAGWELVL